MKVDELTDQIILKYKTISPDICLNCSTVYCAYNNDLGSNCFLCNKKMCGSCAPDTMEDSSINKILFHIYRGCASPRLGINNIEPSIILTTGTIPTNIHSPVVDNSKKEPDNEKICKFYLQKSCRHVKDKTQ